MTLLFLVLQPGAAAGSFAELDEQRVKAIEKMLPVTPSGFGQPISDRGFWTSAQALQFGSAAISASEKLLTQKFPEWDNELYADFSQTGRRPPGEKMLQARLSFLYPLVVAECAENQGRFVPLINHILHEYAKERTWVLPAHDWHGDNFAGRHVTIDLRSSQFAAMLAQALYLLGDKIDPTVRNEVYDAINVRIFRPFYRALRGEETIDWLGDQNHPVKNNWNAVCLAGVVDAAKILVTNRYERACFLAAGEHYSKYFLNGFHADGYCEEGAGYWAYGFGNFVMLRESVLQATSNRVDLFTNPIVAQIAAYGRRIQMTGGLVPPFADCRFGTRVDKNLVAYCDRVLLGREGDTLPLILEPEKLSLLFMPQTPCATNASRLATNGEDKLRDYFEIAGVLVCRPTPNTSNTLSVAIKAGGNGSHSHNDIGSFVLALGGDEIAGDPGGPRAYDNKTFGPERYNRKILNSFGHPVPVVAGQLQSDATKVRAKVLRELFTDARDEIQIDLGPAYNLPELKSLVRTMSFSRVGTGEVEISDAVSFRGPESFEAALETCGTCRQLDSRTFELAFAGKKLRLEVRTPDGFELTQERIEELGAQPFTRLGFRLSEPVKRAEVKMLFRAE